nr:B291 [uncultured bacterium]
MCCYASFGGSPWDEGTAQIAIGDIDRRPSVVATDTTIGILGMKRPGFSGGSYL